MTSEIKKDTIKTWMNSKRTQRVKWKKEDYAGHERRIQQKYRYSEKNQIVVLQMESSINQI
jgi:hypothetical protein